ncbi:MAG: hypothetical protein P4L87_24270, partial [Formivibrio sp.]|nr:hypothetical protein [Formivibrio sp.]
MAQSNYLHHVRSAERRNSSLRRRHRKRALISIEVFYAHALYIMSCSSRSLSGATTAKLSIIGSKTLIDGGGSPRTYSLPDIGADSPIILSAGAQTITGIKTFGAGAAPMFSSLSSGLIGIDTKTLTLNSVALASTTGMSFAFNGSTFTIDTPQDMQTTASPAFTQITLDKTVERYKMAGVFTTSKSIARSAYTQIDSGIAPYQTPGYTDPAGSISATGFTIKKAGNYDVDFNLRINDFGAGSVASLGVAVFINGTMMNGTAVWGRAEQNTGRVSVAYTGCFTAALNDAVTLGVWQNSPAVATIDWFCMRWA